MKNCNEVQQLTLSPIIEYLYPLVYCVIHYIVLYSGFSGFTQNSIHDANKQAIIAILIDYVYFFRTKVHLRGFLDLLLGCHKYVLI